MISKGNHCVLFACFVLLAISEEAETWLPGLFRWSSKTSKKIEDIKDPQNTKRSTRMTKELFADYVKEKNWEDLRCFYTFRNKLSVPLTVVTIFFFVQCMIKQLLDSVFVISRIIKVSVRVISQALPRPWLFWISQKPHPTIVYNIYVSPSTITTTTTATTTIIILIITIIIILIIITFHWSWTVFSTNFSSHVGRRKVFMIASTPQLFIARGKRTLVKF